VSDCTGGPAGAEFEVGHAAVVEPQKDPNVRAVWCHVVSCYWEPLRIELDVYSLWRIPPSTA